MRMHPRRHGAYNFSARMASAIVNSHYKSKKQNGNNSGCLLVLAIPIISIYFIIKQIL